MRMMLWIKEPDLPEGTPNGVLWAKDHLPDESPPEFIWRIYQDWLERGMSKRQLRQRDPSVVILLNAWLREHPRPKYLKGKLLSKEEAYDTLLQQLIKKFPQVTSDDLRRLSDAARRREEKIKPPDN